MRAIDADALLQKGIKVTVFGVTDTDVLNRMMSAFREAVITVPTVKAKPEHGHYIKGDNGEWYCSKCRRIDDKFSVARYCWYCGARMDEEQVEKPERTCYNCKHGGYGFDSDLGCNLWHKGKADPETCEYWEGAKDGQND